MTVNNKQKLAKFVKKSLLNSKTDTQQMAKTAAQNKKVDLTFQNVRKNAMNQQTSNKMKEALRKQGNEVG